MQRRIGFSIVVIMAAIIINFIIPRAMPGDITFYVTDSDMNPAYAQAILKRLGLDRPLWDQFWIYIKDTFTLNFGQSFVFKGRPVLEMIGEALPRTILLLIPAQIISLLVGYFLGVMAGWKAGTKRDSFITGTSLVIWAMPMFWTGMIVLYVGGYVLGWFPISGYKEIGMDDKFTWWQTIWDRIHHIILPTITLATKFGVYQLVMRNTMTITLKQNYIITAKAKGLSEFRVKHRHAARNALLPTVTAAAMRFAMLIAGLIFIETIFSYPGMGKMIFDAVAKHDYPVIQASFLFFALVVIAIIFTLDMVYARLDPRVRYD